MSYEGLPAGRFCILSTVERRDRILLWGPTVYPQRAIITITVSGCVGSTLNTILQNDFRRRGEGQATQPTPATLVTLPTAPSPHIGHCAAVAGASGSARARWCVSGVV